MHDALLRCCTIQHCEPASDCQTPNSTLLQQGHFSQHSNSNYLQGGLCLQALIADKFDPDRVDTLLHTRKGPPKWLTPLIADRAGRELIYTLSARYKNCQLLKYAMQRILKAGHDEEVASVGSRLSGYFEVFHNLMGKRLEEMLGADDARMQVLSRELLVTAMT